MILSKKTTTNKPKNNNNTHTQNKKQNPIFLKNYTSLPTGLRTVNLTIEMIISASYKLSLTLLQALKSYPFFLSLSLSSSDLSSRFTLSLSLLCGRSSRERLHWWLHVQPCPCAPTPLSLNTEAFARAPTGRLNLITTPQSSTHYTGIKCRTDGCWLLWPA